MEPGYSTTVIKMQRFYLCRKQVRPETRISYTRDVALAVERALDCLSRD
jgi:hypothetical protein